MAIVASCIFGQWNQTVLWDQKCSFCKLCTSKTWNYIHSAVYLDSRLSRQYHNLQDTCSSLHRPIFRSPSPQKSFINATQYLRNIPPTASPCRWVAEDCVLPADSENRRSVLSQPDSCTLALVCLGLSFGRHTCSNEHHCANGALNIQYWKVVLYS